jgi:AAA family ATP:ADP antiporter
VSTPDANPGHLVRRRTAGLSVLAFVLIGSYELARTAGESLFLAEFQEAGLPWVWLAVAVAAALAVAVVQRYNTKVPLLRLLGAASLVATALLLLLLLGMQAGLQSATFLLYVWKDVYVVVLVELFWSHANLTFDLKSARRTYWFFCMMGSLGGAAGNLLTGELAGHFGTAATLWALPVLLIGTAAGCFWAQPGQTPLPLPRPQVRAGPAPSGPARGFFRRHPDVVLLIGLVASVQLALTLLDYHYNGVLRTQFPDTDERTRVVGWVYSAINLGAFVLQASTGPILLLLDVSGTLLLNPAILGVTLFSFLLAPHFALLAAAKVLSKALDYSLFRAAKELFYIPLAEEARLLGKPLVDMLTYRVAKAGASLLLLGLGALAITTWALPISLACTVVWLVLAVVAGRRHRRRVSSEV